MNTDSWTIVVQLHTNLS